MSTTSAQPSQSKMDTLLLTSLTNLETALTSLTESITTASPNLPLANTLLTADADLSQNLTHLKTHTENILQLAHLHSLAAQLAETYKSQVKTLSEIRSEILRVNISGPSSLSLASTGVSTGVSTSTTTINKQDENANANANAVEYKTLLSFARSVSRYTAPRGYKTPSVLRAEAEAEREQERKQESEVAVQGEAAAGGNAGAVVANGMESGMNGVLNDQAETRGGLEAGRERNPGIESLAPDVKAWLDPQLQVPFLPWPSEEMVARSGLARVSGWVGAIGVEDDAGVIEQGRESEEEALRKKNEEQRAAAARYDDYEQQQVRSAPKPKVFTGLDLYDPDEE